MDFLYILAGLVGLYLGGEGLVRGSVSLAEGMGVSQLMIGLTIVGMGTSAPELLVSLKAALNGQPNIALGNVVGSNIANVLLILGASAFVYPVMHWDKAIRRDILVALGGALLLAYFAQGQVIGRFAAFLMLAALIAYLYRAYLGAVSKPLSDSEPVQVTRSRSSQALFLSVGFIIVGLVLLVFGADFLVTGASNIARRLGVSEAIIGLTVVAIGTSLPELATSITAALKRHSDVALGNVVGSNVFNILGILGFTALISPVSVDAQIRSFDIPVMVIVTIALAAILFLRHSITKQMGAVMMSLYAAYTIWLFL